MLSSDYSGIHGLFNALSLNGLRSFREKSSFHVMRLLPAFAAAIVALAAHPADARGLHQLREQDRAYRATQQGQIMPLPEIRARIRVRGAQFIGAEFDGRIYRLKFMRGSDVIWIDVDARTGAIVARR